MEIFNIHLFEFLLIAGLALIVFGPQRLPEVGRFLGQQVARFLAWQQNSPELQMLNEVRGEFEREIAELRDELVRTRQQLDLSRDMSAIKEELRPMLDLKGNLAAPSADASVPQAASASNGVAPEVPTAPSSPTAAPGVDPAPAVDAAELVETAVEAAPEPLAVRPAQQAVPAAAQPNRLAYAQPTTALGAPGPSAGDQPTEQLIDERVEFLRRRRESLHDAPEPDPVPAQQVAAADVALDRQPDQLATADASSPSEHDGGDERDQLLRRVQALAAELQALTAELQERGLLRADWRASEQAHEQETMPR